MNGIFIALTILYFDRAYADTTSPKCSVLMNIRNCSFRSLISFMCLLRFADNDCDCQSAIEPEQHFLKRSAYSCDMPVFEDNYSVHYEMFA